MNPIGYYRSHSLPKQGIPRQSQLEHSQEGEIQLLPNMNFETALRDLEGFERIWVLFHFDRNPHWRPTTRPPVPHPEKDRVGIFATRGPYRPNPIGLSCVKLLEVQGRMLRVSGSDLLDQTPVFDIKPYIPQFDSFPDSAIGWMEKQTQVTWSIEISHLALQKASYILEQAGTDLIQVAKVQLATDPFNSKAKRVQWQPLDSHCRNGILAIRTWNLHCIADLKMQTIQIMDISSRYSQNDLANEKDPYGDKGLHKNFSLRNFLS